MVRTANTAGHVNIFKLDDTTKMWSQLGADIDGEAAFDWSGYSVALSDDGITLAVGAPYNAGTARSANHVRLFKLAKLCQLWRALWGGMVRCGVVFRGDI